MITKPSPSRIGRPPPGTKLLADEPSTPGEKETGGSVVRGRLLILVAAVMWSTSSWFVKNPAFDVWPEESRGPLFAFWRALFAGVLLLPLARRPRWRTRLVPMTLCFALMNATYLSSMALTSAANAIWLQSTAPMWVFLAGLLIGEKVQRENVILLTFGMLGVATILTFELQGPRPLGVVYGLVAGMTYGGVVLFVRSLRDMDTAWLISLNLLVTAAVLGPYLVFSGQWLWPNPAQLVLLAGFGFFQMGLPYVLFGRGLRTVATQEATGIALLEPLLVPVWVLYAQTRWWTVVGGALILTGLVIRYASSWRKSPRVDVD